MASSNDMKQMYQPVKPQYPDCKGRQFAGDPAEGSISPDYLDVNYDQYSNEFAQDRPYHLDNLSGDKGRLGYNNPSATSISGAKSMTGRQYADDFKGGYTSYGQTIQDAGQNPSVQRITVDASRADRGKES